MWTVSEALMTTDALFPEVGPRLAAARSRRGLSQSTVARIAGLGPSYLSRVENGRVQPTFRTVVRLMRALELDPEEIVGPTPTRKRPRGACPVSGRGGCLLDLVRPDVGFVGQADRERYTPREIRLLRQLATWMKKVKPDRLRAMEILLGDLTHET